MKLFLASSIAFAVMTGAVLAQQATPAPAGMAQATPPVTGAPMAEPDGMAPPPPPPGGPRAGGPGPMADRGPAGPEGRRGPPPPPRGAHIDLQRGDLRLNLQCAEGEPTKTCADLALQMLDHLQTPRAQ